jgi:hypothetical protein
MTNLKQKISDALDAIKSPVQGMISLILAAVALVLLLWVVVAVVRAFFALSALK